MTPRRRGGNHPIMDRSTEALNSHVALLGPHRTQPSRCSQVGGGRRCGRELHPGLPGKRPQAQVGSKCSVVAPAIYRGSALCPDPDVERAGAQTTPLEGNRASAGEPMTGWHPQAPRGYPGLGDPVEIVGPGGGWMVGAQRIFPCECSATLPKAHLTLIHTLCVWFPSYDAALGYPMITARTSHGACPPVLLSRNLHHQPEPQPRFRASGAEHHGRGHCGAPTSLSSVHPQNTEEPGL